MSADVKKPECVAMEPRCKRCDHGRSWHSPMNVQSFGGSEYFPNACWFCIHPVNADDTHRCMQWDGDDVQWIGQEGFAQAAEDIFSGLRHVYRCCVQSDSPD